MKEIMKEKSNNIFLVFGYGVPKDILKDENYNFYLKLVFNRIYNLVVKNKIVKPVIIFSGGKTDCHKPYKRNEADEMIKLFKELSKKPLLKNIIKSWTFLSEKKSLSTLENFLRCREMILKRKIKKAKLYIFCEQTRERRVKILAKKIFDKNYNSCVVPIDFDVSSNRYLDPEVIVKKEREELKHSLRALKNSENLKKHHKFFEEKIKFLRKAGTKKHEEAVRKWWEMKLGKL